MSGDIKEVKCFNIKSNKEKVIMQKVKLNNGIEMPILGSAYIRSKIKPCVNSVYMTLLKQVTVL